VFVAVICRPGSTTGPAFLHWAVFRQDWFRWTRIPQVTLFIWAAALTLLIVHLLHYRKPVDSGLFWSLAAVFAAFQSGIVGRTATAYWATAALLLLASIIENSYVIAYHDELTSLPGRRAFNDALLRLEKPYVVAAVDIDHFKSVNDTYGHDIGDQVLRMVAARLAHVAGGGKAYRIGGEEFCILFPEKSVKDVATPLEELRTAIENSVFRLRGGQERRSAPRGSDRRVAARSKKAPAPRDLVQDGLSVTVSIGVAEPGSQTVEPEQVIQSADKALYRAKRSGRNRIELETSTRTKVPRAKRTA
jgi:diguanylate cyclase (GGDEF)-like protein